MKSIFLAPIFLALATLAFLVTWALLPAAPTRTESCLKLALRLYEVRDLNDSLDPGSPVFKNAIKTVTLNIEKIVQELIAQGCPITHHEAFRELVHKLRIKTETLNIEKIVQELIAQDSPITHHEAFRELVHKWRLSSQEYLNSSEK